jgi:prolyl oligopeptidase
MIEKLLARTLLTAIVAAHVAAPALADPDANVHYPETRTVEVVDVYHGTEVADPYRWLEDQYADDVADWVKSQNEVTFAYLENLPAREAFEERLTELWDYAKMTAPFRVGDRYFFYRNDGLQNQSVLFVQEGRDGEPRVLLDPNQLSEDGTVALGSVVVNDQATMLAYSVSESGSDWRSWHVRNIETGEDLPDVLRNSKFSGASWLPDGSGFYYCAYPAVEEETKLMDANSAMQLFFHRLGDAQEDDRLVYARPELPKWGYDASVTDDGQYLVINVWEGSSSANRIYYAPLVDGREGEVVELLAENDARYSFVDNDGSVFFFRTDLDAPLGRLIAIDTNDPAREEWVTVIPEGEDALQTVDLVNEMFAATYMHNAHEKVRLFDMQGSFVRDVDLPPFGNVGGFSGKREDTETFYSFTSFLSPTEIYHYDFETGQSERFWSPDLDFDFDQYAVEQVFYESKDGTKVPMYVIYKKGLQRDGSNPTLLYGYGGFNVSLLPRFSVSVLPWLEKGGVYAHANLRGGGEFGEEWHQAGMLHNKQNVFDDFIAAGEWLVENDFTRPDKLACRGGSNGGTLVGAVINQRPDLFGAALPAVGVMDMLRFHKWTIGWAWVSDYGSSDDPEQFETLYAYSPYHNLTEQEYPATLVTTADHDDRVVPGHSFKYAAKLQAVQQGDNPVLIRIESKAGHGAGKPTAKRIEEAADIYAFLAWNLGMDVQPGL